MSGYFAVNESQQPPSPTSFTCHLPESTLPPDELVERMALVIQAIGSGKRFKASWTAAPNDDKTDPDVSQIIYDIITQAPEVFRAKRYQIGGDFQLLDLSGLESLRPMCSGKDRLLTALGYTRNFEGDAVNFEVETRADGHRLVVESRGGFDVYGLEEKLGVEFV
jgi:hypothetical protein